MSTTFPEGYWKGKKAAISLSYDDGYASNLDIAIPQLEAAGFRGSFNLHVQNPEVQRNIARWKRAFENGHEIGNHSFTHPCGTRLLRMTKEELENEIGSAEHWLSTNIGVDEFRSYVYPCTEITANDMTIDGTPIPKEFSDMYFEVVKNNCIFSRTGFGALNNDYTKLSIDQHKIDGKAIQFPHGTDSREFIEYCESALETGAWAIVIFHGIGDSHYPTDTHVHQELIDYLKRNEDKYWVATFQKIARFIIEYPQITNQKNDGV